MMTSRKPPEEIKLAGHISPEEKLEADYRMIPFDVPDGICRLDVEYAFSRDEPGGILKEAGNIIDIGLFDSRGSEFLTARGFRGWSGSARRALFIGTNDASPGYIPGPMPSGRWHIILGMHRVLPEGCDFKVTVKMQPGVPESDISTELTEGSIVGGGPAWYRGDLHCHTHHSDAQGSLGDLVAMGRAQGLDFIAVTEHNTVSHLAQFGKFGGEHPLLIPGEEITTDHGHANVWGIQRWQEFRCRTSAQMAQVADQAKEQGCLISINHPKESGPPWTFGDESRYDCIEVWQLAWFMFNNQSLALWDRLLCEGHRITAVGGSDYHQEPFTGEIGVLALGTPCTWVYAEELSERAILEGIKIGRVFISESPTGPRIFLEAVAEDQEAKIGDVLTVASREDVQFQCRVEGATGCDLWICSHGDVKEWAIEGDEWTCDWTTQVVGNTYFRAEVRQQSQQGDAVMHAMSNPIYVQVES
ncbi:MAG: hypothetical protein GTO18_14590 [Anaerolineales bacterium]|nr:hypothetical protein [Anaerolineales bacterium]